MSLQRSLMLIALSTGLAGCREPNIDIYRCTWRGIGEWKAYAVTADASVANNTLHSLQIVSTVGVIPDGPAGTCRYTLRGRHFQRVRDEAGTRQLRMLDDRGAGIGYLRYVVEDDALIITLPIKMSAGSSKCLVGPPAMR
jgi:hypothetical protein